MFHSSRYDLPGIAPWYDECIRARESLSHELILPNLFELIGKVDGLEVCDLACGQGVVARWLAAHKAKVTGIDLSEQMLTIARREEERESFGIAYLHEDAQTCTLISDSAFDGVVCNIALLDIPDISATAHTIARILRPEGWCVWSLLHPCGPATTEDGLLLAYRNRNYFEEGFWQSSNMQSVRGRIGTFHRTLSSYLNMFLDAGFYLERMVEPQATGELARRIRGYDRVPVAILTRWRKVGTR